MFAPAGKERAISKPNPVKGNPVFGGYLQMDANGGVPLVVRLCIEEVEKRGTQTLPVIKIMHDLMNALANHVGMDTVGIYRLSGPAKSIERYRVLFNQGKSGVSVA